MTDAATPAGFRRTIRVKPETGRLAEVRRFVEEVTAGLPLDMEKVFDLKVAVSEACANAVKHAGRQTPVEITAMHDTDRLTFVVTDHGRFHTPASDRTDGENRGLGMPLMVALMDEVTFTRLPEGGTRVRLSALLGGDK